MARTHLLSIAALFLLCPLSLLATEPLAESFGPFTMQPGVLTYISGRDEFDFDAFEEVSFVGTVSNLDQTRIALWSMAFVYKDPNGETVFGSFYPTILLLPGESESVRYETTLPVCSSVVAVHMRLGIGPVQVAGTLTRVCVPECSSFMLLSMGLLIAVCLCFGKRAFKRS